ALNLGWSADALSDGVDRVAVVNNATTGFNVTSGSKNIATLEGTGNTSVSAGATLTATHVRQNALTVANTSHVVIRADGSGTGVSYLNSLNLNSNGVLDLKDNDLVVSYGTAANPFT